MADQDRNIREALDGLDRGKRETLTRLITGSAFVAPIVASFAMQGLAISPAHAASSALTNTTVSDIRLKRDVVRVGTHENGCGIYRFKYLWSDTEYFGAIAQEVAQHAPEAVSDGPGGFLAVDYAALGMIMRPATTKAH